MQPGDISLLDLQRGGGEKGPYTIAQMMKEEEEEGGKEREERNLTFESRESLLANGGKFERFFFPTICCIF